MTTRLALVLLALNTTVSTSCDSSPDCEALTREAGNALDEVIRASAGPCSQDSECTHVAHSSACHDFCDRTVLASSLEAIAQARARINTDPCEEFSAASCKLEIPPCEGPGRAVCRDGVCTEEE